ncbi:MAG: sigma 54-interacting transcriptional regulator [Tissierellia bacterium]|nr:sigma 54-interacting transcriptional regulator [Tissierellia bacterium]
MNFKRKSNIKDLSVIRGKNNKLEELQRQKDFYEMLINASTEGILSVDMDGIITFINPAGMKILGITKNVIGKHITQGVDFEPTILHVLKTKEGYVDREFRLESKRGVVHFVKTAIPLINEEGEMVGVLDIFRNIDDIKDMINRLTGAQAKYSITNIMGESPQIQEIRKLIRHAGSNDSTVLIDGESGTGKDIIAQAIHNYSNRSEGPYISVNCLSMPRNLIEGELFGYDDAGSFAGHIGASPGKIEMAQGGTLFLNNISYLPLELQNKLAKVLQNKTVVRIGGFKEIPIDIRVISTSHLNLSDLVKEKKFNSQLFDLVSNFTISTSPLRERKVDIEAISKQTLNQCNLMYGTNKSFSKESMKFLRNYHWPDNVRELENVIECAYFNSEEDVISPEHLYSKRRQQLNIFKQEGPITLKEAEEQAVRKALKYTAGNITQAAKILGIGRNTLYGKIKEFNIIL